MAEIPPCCPSCGEVLPILEEFERHLAERDEVIRGLEKDLRVKRSQLTKLTADQTSSEEVDPLRDQALEVFDYWRSRISPKARELTGERFRAVVARLRAGHSVADLKRAIDGAKSRPREPGATTSLTSICRSDENLLMFMNWADLAERKKPARGPLIALERVAAMQARLDQPAILQRLLELRGWTREAVLALGLGLDGDRVAFFVRDAEGKIIGICRYQPNPSKRSGAKLLAEGSRDLFPAPETETAKIVWLVEGEPDAVAIRSAGLPGIAVPGVNTWKKDWAERFARFDRVLICLDADAAGRKAAQERLRDLSRVTNAQVIDVDPARSDGWDVGDVLLERGDGAGAFLSGLSVERGGVVMPMASRTDRPYDRIIQALEDAGCRVRETGHGKASSTCPNHDDRQPSLAIAEGDDRRVLLHCHAGCENEEILAVLGYQLRDLFPASAGLS